LPRLRGHTVQGCGCVSVAQARSHGQRNRAPLSRPRRGWGSLTAHQFMRFRLSCRNGPKAPKGRNTIAQGHALGPQSGHRPKPCRDGITRAAHLNRFFLTNDNKYGIMFRKIRNHAAPEDQLNKKGAFQYALSSRKYCKILEFSPVFGFKRAMRFPFIRNGLRRKKGHFLCMKRRQMTPFASLEKAQKTLRLYLRARIWLKPLLDKPGQDPAVVQRRQL